MGFFTQFTDAEVRVLRYMWCSQEVKMVRRGIGSGNDNDDCFSLN